MTSFRAVVVWAALVFAITFVAALPVLIAGIDLTKVTFSSEIPVVAGVGIILTGYAPTLAAILVSLLPGNGGVRALLRPVLQWRVSALWYVAVFVVPAVLFLVAVGIHVGAGMFHHREHSRGAATGAVVRWVVSVAVPAVKGVEIAGEVRRMDGHAAEARLLQIVDARRQ